jgi:hypothetical protein
MLNGNGLKERDQFCSPRGTHVGGGLFQLILMYNQCGHSMKKRQHRTWL